MHAFCWCNLSSLCFLLMQTACINCTPIGPWLLQGRLFWNELHIGQCLVNMPGDRHWEIVIIDHQNFTMPSPSCLVWVLLPHVCCSLHGVQWCFLLAFQDGLNGIFFMILIFAVDVGCKHRLWRRPIRWWQHGPSDDDVFPSGAWLLWICAAKLAHGNDRM